MWIILQYLTHKSSSEPRVLLCMINRQDTVASNKASWRPSGLHCHYNSLQCSIKVISCWFVWTCNSRVNSRLYEPHVVAAAWHDLRALALNYYWSYMHWFCMLISAHMVCTDGASFVSTGSKVKCGGSSFQHQQPPPPPPPPADRKVWRSIKKDLTSTEWSRRTATSLQQMITTTLQWSIINLDQRKSI